MTLEVEPLKILVAEMIADEGIEHLREQGFEVDVRLGLSHGEILDIIGQYHGLIVRSVTDVNAELVERAARLKVVGRAGNGIDNIDVPACTQKGIVVVNTPESNTMAAAELAIGLAFAIFRNIPQANAAGRAKDFRRKLFSGFELEGKTVGIIGLGRIGSIVARKLKGCGMNVVAYDPYITDERFRKVGVEKCETLDDLLVQSHLVTIHTPKTSETYGMVGEREMELCPRGVVFVNAARGGLIQEEALYKGLQSGHVYGAGIDVLDPEPGYDKRPEEQTYYNKLMELENVIVTPHLGASTAEAHYNVGTAVARLVGDSLQDRMVAAVNMPALHVKDMEGLRPYLDLAEILGKIYYQAERDTVEKLEVIYNGTLAEEETGIITLSAIKGFLEPVVREKVNYVNAPLLLENMGVELVESKSSQQDQYTNLITLRFTTKRKTLSLSGTVFARHAIRLTDFFGYRLEVEPRPYIIAVQNTDAPGIIGKIGTVLGEVGINIAAMQWSRNRRGEKAVGFISVDQEADAATLEALQAIEGTLQVSMMKF